MPKPTFILLLFLWSLHVNGQERYMGIVSDVGSRTPVDKVLVLSSPSGKTSYTDITGFFQTELYKGNTITLDYHYYILNNIFYFGINEILNFALYSLDGKTIMKAEISKKGAIKLPSLPVGYYIIELYSLSNHFVFFLFSNGQSNSLIQRKNTTKPIIQTDSSLIFSKQGYFSREASLPDTDSILNINILKKEYDSLDYFNTLIRQEAFVMLHSSPPISNYGEVMSIKALYDTKEDIIYYSNVKKYDSHYVFAKKFLGFTGSNLDFYHTQYGDSPYRFLNLVTINYYKNIDKYVFEFGAYDQVNCEGISKTYKKLLKTSFFNDKLYFYPNNLKWKDCSDIPIIKSEEIFLGQNYQALNIEEGYGFLKKVDVKDLPKTYIGKHDIVLLNDVPNDLSVVSGIITTEFQTPLSHINILSHNRKTPNMALRDGWDNQELLSLLDELVYLKVSSDSFIIRKAYLDEATQFWNKREPHVPVVLQKDTETSGLIDLHNHGVSSVKLIGGKAANFAELVKLGNIPVPENYFAIPFYYYQKHIENNGIDTVINKLLNDEQFKTNIEYRRLKLKELRDFIKDAPLDQWLKNEVKNKIKNFSEFTSFRFRSSTNAEDLENFSGAGLYDSYSAKKGHSKKTIERAIKKVWASLWNLRAFDEREYYKIDHKSTAMGILVHRSFPDEDANGVIITKNLYNVNHGYIFNVQYKEYSIVYPEQGVLHDQIIVYTISLENKDYTIEYLTHSNVKELQGGTVLTDDEIYELADYCTTIKRHYYYDLPNECNCSYNDFAMDLELKVDSQVNNRKVYIKQARIYSTK